MFYPAIFIPVVEGGYGVIFPDVPESITEGQTLEEALEMAEDALNCSVEEYAARSQPLPRPSSLEETALVLKEHLDAPGVDTNRAPLIQFIAARLETPEINLNADDLAAIDAKAASLDMTRSDFLLKAAEAFGG